LVFSNPSYITFPSDADWKQKESEHFRVIYNEGQSRQGDRALIAAEKAFKTLTAIFKEFPEKTWIVLADHQDSTNGYALNFPYPHMVIYTCPPEAGGQLSALDDWFNSIIFHEYTHILHLYPAHGLWRIGRAIFGSIIVPNGLLPSHFHEGMATLMETEFSTGGRGRGTIFSMFRRKAVEANLWGNEFVPLDLLEGSQTRWPTGISPYFFGYTLHKELWNRKGKEGIWDLTLNYSYNMPYLFLDGPLEDVYNVGYSELWKEIFEKGEKEANNEIEQIKKQPLSKLDYFTDSRHYKWDVTFSPDGKRVVTRRNSPEKLNAFEFYDLATKKSYKTFEAATGDTEGLCWIKWQGSEYLIYAKQEFKNNRSTKQLVQLDLENDTEFIYSNNDFDLSHVHKIACHPSQSKIVAYTEQAGAGLLQEVVLDIKEHKLTLAGSWKIPEGSWIPTLLHGQNYSLFFLREGWTSLLYQWNFKAPPQRILTLPHHAYNLKFGKSEDEILAIVTKDERDEVWEINPRKKQIAKKIALIGGVNAFDYMDEQFVVSSYEHGGFDIAIAEEISGKKETIAADRKPQAENKTENVTASEETAYSPLGTLLPRTWVPSLLVVPDGIQFGAWIPGFDLSQKHFYDIFGGYDTRGLPFISFSYNYRFGAKYTLDVNAQYLPSYDIGLQTFIERWGGSMGLSARFWKLPKIRLAALYRKLESIPALKTTFFHSIGFEVDLSESWGLKSKPLAISPVNGVSSYLNYAYFPKAVGSTANYFTVIAGLDAYVENPIWSESVFYLGNKVGYTEGSTFFNSYFQGGGEQLFSQARNLFLNRGYLNGSFSGRRIFTSNFEYRFPIARIDRGIWLYPTHLKRIHAALTLDATSNSLDSDARGSDRTVKDFLRILYYSAGLEIRTDWKFGFYLPTLIRFGVYRGLTPLITSKGVNLAQDLQFVLGLEASL